MRVVERCPFEESAVHKRTEESHYVQHRVHIKKKSTLPHSFLLFLFSRLFPVPLRLANSIHILASLFFSSTFYCFLLRFLFFYLSLLFLRGEGCNEPSSLLSTSLSYGSLLPSSLLPLVLVFSCSASFLLSSCSNTFFFCYTFSPSCSGFDC